MKKGLSLQALRNFWERWSTGSVNRKIFGATMLVGAITVLVKIVGFGREIILSYVFGTGDALDAFYIALLLPAFVTNVVVGALKSACIPTYIQVQRQQGDEPANRLFTGVLFWNVLLVGGLALLLAIASPYILPLMASAFSPEKLALTRSLLLILLVMMVLGSFVALWGGVLNTQDRFAQVAAAPALVTIGSIVLLLTLGNVLGVYALAIGMVVGTVGSVLLIGRSLKRTGVPIMPRWYGSDASFQQVVGQFFPVLAAAFLSNNASLIDNSMAAMIGEGSVSALNYGRKLPALFIGVSSLALSTAILPHFSRMTAAHDWDGVRSTLRIYTRLFFAAMLPVALILVFFSEPIVGILFNRGAFTDEDVKIVSGVQAMYALNIPFYVINNMTVRVISSLKKNHFLTIASVMSLLLNIGFNYLFIYFIGLKGIALSTTMVYFFSWVFLTIMVHRGIKNLEKQ